MYAWYMAGGTRVIDGVKMDGGYELGAIVQLSLSSDGILNTVTQKIDSKYSYDPETEVTNLNEMEEEAYSKFLAEVIDGVKEAKQRGTLTYKPTTTIDGEEYNAESSNMTGTDINENKFSKKTKHTLLESIFDKVANIVKGKSDKEKAAIEALKKFGLEIGKPFYSFTYLPTRDSQEGEASAIEYFTKLTPEQREQHKVPMLNGFDGPIERDGLKKIVIKSIEETEDGQVKTIFADGDYNFKTGNFEDVNSAVENIMDPDSIEKELGDVDYDEILTQGLKMVPYNGSLWQEFMDKADKR